jgi:arsenate reductase (thioredoxin)
MPLPLSVQTALLPVQEELAKEFDGTFSRETVDQFVEESAVLFAHPTIVQYLPSMVQRYARDLLRAVAQTNGAIPKRYPEVLFVCVMNAARSQMAAALLEHRSGGRVHARCAGTRPAHDIQSGVPAVMAEIGITLDDAYPKPLHPRLVEAADFVITLGCGDACPVLPGRTYEDWDLPDPKGMSQDGLRSIRDELDQRVQSLLVRISPSSNI